MPSNNEEMAILTWLHLEGINFEVDNVSEAIANLITFVDPKQEFTLETPENDVQQAGNLKRLWESLQRILTTNGINPSRFTIPDFMELAKGSQSELAVFGVGMLVVCFSSSEKEAWIDRLGVLEEELQLSLVEIMDRFMMEEVEEGQDDLRLQLYQMTMERDTLAKTINELQDSKSSRQQITTLVNRCEELEQLLQESEKERQTLQEALSRKVKPVYSSPIASQRKGPSSPAQDVQDLRTLAKTLLVEKKRLETELLDSNTEIDLLKQEVKELMSRLELMETESKLEQTTENSQQIDSTIYVGELERQVEQLQATIEALTLERDQLASQLSHALMKEETLNSNRQTETDKLMEALHESQQQLEQQEDIITRQHSKIKELHSYIKSLQDHLETLQNVPPVQNNDQLEILQETIDSQAKEIARLKKELSNEKAARLADGLDPRLLAKITNRF